MANDIQTGKLSIAIMLELPVTADQYKIQRGDTERKNFILGEWDCTESTGVDIADRFRKMHPELGNKVSILWTGPRKL